MNMVRSLTRCGGTLLRVPAAEPAVGVGSFGACNPNVGEVVRESDNDSELECECECECDLDLDLDFPKVPVFDAVAVEEESGR